MLTLSQKKILKLLDDRKEKISGEFKKIEEDGIMQINGVLIDVDDNQKAIKIEKLYQEIKINAQ